MDLGKLIQKARGKRSRDALGRETALTGKAIENYEIRGRRPEPLPLARIALASPEPFRSQLLEQLPGELWKVAAAMIDAVCESRGLDKPVIILESLRSGPPISSPRPAARLTEPDFARQASISREYSGEQPQKRKRPKR